MGFTFSTDMISLRETVARRAFISVEPCITCITVARRASTRKRQFERHPSNDGIEIEFYNPQSGQYLILSWRGEVSKGSKEPLEFISSLDGESETVVVPTTLEIVEILEDLCHIKFTAEGETGEIVIPLPE
jgi:hypothetical protein